MENTSCIAKVSYRVEDWLDKGLTQDEIREKIDDLKGGEKPEIPKNLEYIDGYFDKVSGSSACAFLDKNTGETIVGFAGTNNGNGWIEFCKDAATDIILLGATGLHKEHFYLDDANKFMRNLKSKGYNVTQTTGHSLGGALCVYIGVNHNVPQIVTYNGAPLYVAPTAYLLGNSVSIKNQLEEYKGQVIRFVSDKDWLNSSVDAMNGFYFGEEYLIHNGKSHSIEFYLGTNEQEKISEVLSNSRFNEINIAEVDFDGDGKSDISLDNKDLRVKNIFASDGLYSGNGVDIKIDPQAFYSLSGNLKQNMAETDIGWINDAIKLCIDKNDYIKNDKIQREDVLCSKIVEGLNEASLTRLVGSIDESHGELVKDESKNAIKQLSEFDTYFVTRKFDRWGSSSGRTWYLDGIQFDQNDLIKWVEDLKDASSILYHQITTSGEFSYNDYSGKQQVYKYDTLSEIGQAFVNTTNTFLSKAEEVFKGTGLRSGKNDGIVNSISEVLEFEMNNVLELKKQIINIAEISYGLGKNFDNIEEWLSKDIEEGNISGKYEMENLPNTYTAYLEENNILDDVKDVLEAYDLQVEEASQKLSKCISDDFNDLITRTQNKLKVLFTALGNFITPIESLDNIMGQYVTSKYTIRVADDNENISIVNKETRHGTLADLFPINIVNCIQYSKTYLVPVIESLQYTICVLDLYSSEICNLKEYFSYVIEKAVYNSMELGSIIQAQNLIGLRTNRMVEEIKKVCGNLKSQFKGQSLDAYITQLDSMIKLLEYFNLMINDCFGTNLESN